jgi:hypothetical protein
MDKLFELDPNGSVLGFADMMRKQIVMPAHLMDDGQHHGKTGRNLFAVSYACHPGVTHPVPWVGDALACHTKHLAAGWTADV